MSTSGWIPEKFVVKHYRRGDILDGEAFVLVPERDPAALIALRAYAAATPDPELSGRLAKWANSLGKDDNQSPTPDIVDKLPGWVATLARAVQAGSMDVETALFRIAGYALQDKRPAPVLKGDE